jgi:hypothetical protein
MSILHQALTLSLFPKEIESLRGFADRLPDKDKEEFVNVLD